MSQYEMEVNPVYNPQSPCDRLKYENQHGTEVKCQGTVTWQRSISPNWLVGHCSTCKYVHGKKTSAA